METSKRTTQLPQMHKKQEVEQSSDARKAAVLVIKLLAGDMAQWLGALAGLAKDPNSVLSTHGAAHNCL